MLIMQQTETANLTLFDCLYIVNKLNLDQFNRDVLDSNSDVLFTVDDEGFGSIDEEDPIEMMNKKEEREKRKKRPKKPMALLKAHKREAEQTNCLDPRQEQETAQSPGQGIFETSFHHWNNISC